MKPKIYQRTKKWFERHKETIQGITNIVTVLGTVFAVYISAKSLSSSNEALQLTRKSLIDSERKDSLSDIKADQQALLIQQQLEYYDSTTEKNLRIQRGLLQASQENTRNFMSYTEMANRGYLGISNHCIAYLKDGKFYGNIYFKNYGKTPIYEVKIMSYILTAESCEIAGHILQDRNNMIASKIKNSYGMIGSDQEFTWANYSTISVDKDLILFLAFEFSYKDIYKKAHTFHYLLRYREKDNLEPCRYYNTSD